MWKDLFAFTKAERRGMIVLSIILLLILLFRVFKEEIFPSKPLQISVEHITYVPPKQTSYQPLALVEFDPNSADSLLLSHLHLPKRIINNILNYRRAGGKFKQPDDLLKLYAIDSAWMDSLRDYISIKSDKNRPDIKVAQEKKKRVKYKNTYQAKNVKTITHKARPKIELNAADTTLLKTIYGIGSVYAKRIVNFRRALGGYYHIEQLKEVYGMREESYQKIYTSLTIDTSLIEKIAINKLWQYRLQKHPYCSKNQAKAIIHYRKENGKIADFATLKSLEVIDEKWERLRPYVTY